MQAKVSFSLGCILHWKVMTGCDVSGFPRLHVVVPDLCGIVVDYAH